VVVVVVVVVVMVMLVVMVVVIITVVMMVVIMFATADQDHRPAQGRNLGGIHPRPFVGAAHPGGGVGVERDGQIDRVKIGARAGYDAPWSIAFGPDFKARGMGTSDPISYRGLWGSSGHIPLSNEIKGLAMVRRFAFLTAKSHRPAGRGIGFTPQR
jgi:hypothetical protein